MGDLNSERQLGTPAESQKILAKDEARFDVIIQPNSYAVTFIPLLYANGNWLPVRESGMSSQFLQLNGSYGIPDTSNIYSPYTNALISRWAQSLLFFDPVRSLERPASKRLMDDGSDLVQKLYDWSQDRQRANKWHQFRTTVLNQINELLIPNGIPEITAIEVIGGSAEPALQVKVNEIPLELQSLGSGLSEIVLISASITMDKGKQMQYFIEEPESHLHPGLLRRFIEQLSKHDNIQFFITTHSNVLLDCLDKNDRIFQFTQASDGHTEIRDCLSLIEYHDTLDALGVRASSLLQTNCVIWVEGPSDRLYIRHMLSDYAQQKGEALIEGSDYSFVIYGGSNLSHFELAEDELSEPNDLVSMLRISRYSAVVMDRDLSPGTNNSMLKSRKQKIIDAANGDEKHRLAKLTDGREIENDFPREILCNVIADLLKENPTRFSQFRFAEDVSFTKEIAKFLEPTDEAKQKSIYSKLQRNKILIAELVLANCQSGFTQQHCPNWLPALYDHVVQARNI